LSSLQTEFFINLLDSNARIVQLRSETYG
jgi:hypothetical protein